jgi:hypothetical protein
VHEFDTDQPFADIEERDPEEEETLERCHTEDRESMTNKETAECAGVELKEMYENEEVGGT